MFALFCTILHLKKFFQRSTGYIPENRLYVFKKIVQPFVKYSYVLNYIMKGNNSLLCQAIIKS